MQLDLNRFSLEANLPAPVSRVDEARWGAASVSTLDECLYQRFGRINRKAERQEKRTPNLFNQLGILFISGSYRRSTQVRFSERDEDILTNFPVALDVNTPLSAQAIFPESGDAWDVLERLIGTVDGPPDWSSQHDHYLYGTPKR